MLMIAAAVSKNSVNSVIPETLDGAAGILLFDAERPIKETVRFVTGDYVPAMLKVSCEAILCGAIHDKALFERIAEGCITRYDASGMTVPQAVAAMNCYRLPFIRDYVGGTGCHDHG